MNRITAARTALNLGTALVTLAGTGVAVLLLENDLHATGTHRTLWLTVLAVAAFLAVDRLVDTAVAPLVDRLDPPQHVMTVTCGTEGCPVEIEVTGRMSVEDDDHLVELATDHTRHGAASGERHLDRRWEDTDTLADLGDLMALWLEGKVASWPGYAPGYGPDEETRELIPTLAAANRAGYVTVASQPGVDPEVGFDGLVWQQKAGVEGFVRDRDLLQDLVDAADEAGLDVEVADTLDTGERGIVVTLRGGEPHTTFGGYIDGRELRHAIWPGIGSSALDDVFRSTRVTLAAPEYGAAAGLRVWQALESVISRASAAGGTASDSR